MIELEQWRLTNRPSVVILVGMRRQPSAERIGQTFGRWTITEQLSNGWRAQCSCGTERAIEGENLRRELQISCGCAWVHHGHASYNAETPEYAAWVQMRFRCSNPQWPGYHNYGGRGIKVCVRWQKSFENFLADMGHRPFEATSLDRIDVDGPYSPQNCRWATAKEQANNRTNNVRVMYQGEEVTLPVAAERSGIKLGTLHARLRAGWVKEELFKPLSKHHQEMALKGTKVRWE